MVGVVDILVEETIVRLSGKLLYDGPQVVGYHITVPMTLKIGFYDFAEKVGAQARSKHVQHPTALGVGK